MTVLNKIKTKLSRNTKEQIEQLELLKQSKILDELNNLHNKGMEEIELTELSGMINGRENILNHLLMLIKAARTRINMVLTTSSLLDILELFKTDLEKAKKKGVKINISTKLNKSNKQLLKKYGKIAKIRDTDLNSRFCIVDDQEMLFMLVDDAKVHRNYDSAIWMNSPYFATAFSQMFESY